MPYKCADCGRTSNDKVIDGGDCMHDWEPLHMHDRAHGNTASCPRCQGLRNGIMKRHCNGRDVYCCSDCAMEIRAKPGQRRADTPPIEATRYNLKNPEPGKVFTFGPEKKPLLSDMAIDV